MDSEYYAPKSTAQQEVIFMDCRSTERRQWIVANYNVTPVAHIQLLAGQTKHSDAGAVIENDYYIFRSVHKVSGVEEIIQCGMGAAKDFLRLLNHEGLPIFNPLHGEHGGGQGGNPGGNSGGNGGRRETEVWNPVAKQLYNAIMWVILIIDAEPNTPVFDIREKVYKFKDREPFQSQVKAVNTIINKNLPGRTLTEAIEELRERNNVRDEMCRFDMLVDIINNYTDKDGNHVEVQSYF